MEVTTRGAASLSISFLNLEAILLVVVCCHTSLELRIVFVLDKNRKCVARILSLQQCKRVQVS